MHKRTFDTCKLPAAVTVWEEGSKFYGKVGSLVERKGRIALLIVGGEHYFVEYRKIAYGDNSKVNGFD
jgi:hypothetical protein